MDDVKASHNKKHRVREEEKFDAEMRDKLESKPTYAFAWLLGGVTLIGIIIAVVLLTGIAALAL